jgi:hypothetical protein
MTPDNFGYLLAVLAVPVLTYKVVVWLIGW